MIHIPKKILKKLKLQSIEESKKVAAKVEEARAIENTERFKASMDVVDKIGKEIGEMREWAPYCSDAASYSPFPMDILKLNNQQLIQLLIHAYGTADHLSRELKSLKKCIDGKK
jgi:hypothetical protein